MARLEATVMKFLTNWPNRPAIIDDFGLTHLETTAKIDLMIMIEDRPREKSTIIVSSTARFKWYDIIGKRHVPDAYS